MTEETNTNATTAKKERTDYEFNSPTSYSVGMKDFFEDLIVTDDAKYFPFVLNADARHTLTNQINFSLNDDSTRRRELSRACEEATCRSNPSVSQSNPKRSHPKLFVGILYLPAKKGDQIHLHGFIRIPKLELREETSLITIREDQCTRAIVGPSTLKHAVEEITRRLWTNNIWIANRDGLAITEQEQDFASLRKYLNETAKEQRLWDGFEMLPHHVFSRLRNPARKGAA